MRVEYSDRVKKLPPYLFVEIDRAKKRALSEGKDIINLGIGDPDTPTPAPIIERLCHAAGDPKNHQYAMDAGMLELRRVIAAWYKERFGVDLNPETEVLPLIGSKEGIAHIPLAYVNPGDKVLVPEPGYPVYQASTWFAGGDVITMPLKEEHSYLPQFDAINRDHLKHAKLMFLNYPNNPTGATAPLNFFEEAVAFAKEHNICICHDAAYTEIYFDNNKPDSFLKAKDAKEVGIEFHSLSKTYNMTGWRIGFAVGNADMIKALGIIKSNVDSGIFQAIQYAGIEAFNIDESQRVSMLRMYQQRRDTLVNGLLEAGWSVASPQATFYVWARIPGMQDSRSFALKLLSELGVVATPGVGFGPSGEGYIRFALTVPSERIKEAISRIRKLHAYPNSAAKQ
ncbi:MAG: LL-diaminopimelate aminotransferase [Chlamydiota bacterium]|nr:LL-diaminopimelate aminotransferase [Chlamydiota bacterium]